MMARPSCLERWGGRTRGRRAARGVFWAQAVFPTRSAATKTGMVHAVQPLGSVRFSIDFFAIPPYEFTTRRRRPSRTKAGNLPASSTCCVPIAEPSSTEDHTEMAARWLHTSKGATRKPRVHGGVTRKVRRRFDLQARPSVGAHLCLAQSQSLSRTRSRYPGCTGELIFFGDVRRKVRRDPLSCP